MPPRNNLTGNCGGWRWGGKAVPLLANLKCDLMTGPPWGFCMVNISKSSPTAEMAHSQAKAHSPCRARLSVLCLRWAELYLCSPYKLWNSHTLFITASGLQPHHSLVRLVVVRLTAERSGGCVLWVARNG